MEQEMEVDHVEYHPLLNSLILKNIFKFLRLKDLKICRLVCPEWNDVSSAMVQEMGVVKLSGNGNVEVDSGIVQFLAKTLHQFLKTFEDVLPENIFFRNYQLNSWYIHGRCQLGVSFWNKFGVTMKSVELCSARFLGIDSMRDVLFNLTPKLQRLYLRNCSFYNVTDADMEKSGFHVLTKATETKLDVPINRNMISLGFFGGEPHVQPPLTWKEFFIAYPNLKQLQMYNLTTTETSEVLEAIAQRRIQQNPGSLNLQKLNVFNGEYALQQMEKEHIESLCTLNISLTYLHVDIGVFVVPHQFQKLLQNFCKSLKKLKLYRGPLATPLDTFPFKISFPNLTILKITDTVANNFNFLKHMPKLKELCISYMVENTTFPILYTDMVRNTTAELIGPFPSLRSFSADYNFRQEDFVRIVQWFPNVTKFQMYMDDAAFSKVCEKWKKLIDIDIRGPKVTDNGILGEVYRAIDGNGNSREHRMHSYFLDLTELRSFKMNNDGMSTRITDLSIMQGFMNVKSLVHFELCSEHVLDGWRALHENKKIQTLTPSDGSWDNHRVERFKRKL